VVFTELGTSPRTVEALAKEAKVTAVPIATHNMPSDGNYFSFERGLSTAIIQGLKQ
jgi:ABC-type Zn uptake system ZnuABC Zn-binding protein ZnuA